MDTGLLISAIIGLLVAAAIYYGVPGRIRGGILLTLFVGAIGAIIMTWLGRQVGLAAPGQTLGYFVAVIGTALVMAVWRTVMGRE